MFIFYLFSLCIFFFASSQGAILTKDDRITGGYPVNINEHPYQVALLHRNPTGVFTLACGGTILGPNIILTAAQCLTGTQANQWQVKAGSSYFLPGGSGHLRSISKFIIHSGYQGFPLMTDDIALVFLSSDLALDDSMKAAKLPNRGADIAVGTLTNVTGWGSKFEGGPAQEVLNVVTVPIVDHSRCLSSYSGYVTITNNMLCAGIIGVGGEDFCSRDTGGPLVHQREIIYGIASFGYSCGNPNFPGVYTKVSNYIDWINSNK